ncbi:MAG: hypothetical protein IJ867_05440 [Clostridia bacterium]|nr:hypothetical protein [Clostridia bacterium]
MPNNSKKKNQNNVLRIVILVVVGIVAAVVSVYMNVMGMKGVINKESNPSGMAGFSLRATGDGSLSTSTTQNTRRNNPRNRPFGNLPSNCQFKQF